MVQRVRGRVGARAKSYNVKFRFLLLSLNFVCVRA